MNRSVKLARGFRLLQQNIALDSIFGRTNPKSRGNPTRGAVKMPQLENKKGAPFGAPFSVILVT